MQFYCPSLWCPSHGSYYVIVLYLLFILGWIDLSIHEDVYVWRNFELQVHDKLLLFFLVFCSLCCVIPIQTHLQTQKQLACTAKTVVNTTEGYERLWNKVGLQNKALVVWNSACQLCRLGIQFGFSAWGIRSRTWNEWGVVPWGQPIIELRDSFRCHKYYIFLFERCSRALSRQSWNLVLAILRVK